MPCLSCFPHWGCLPIIVCQSPCGCNCRARGSGRLTPDWSQLSDPRGFAVDPLCDPRWDYFTLSRLAYRGHDVAVSWRRGRSGLTVALDGREAAHSPDLAHLYIPLDG